MTSSNHLTIMLREILGDYSIQTSRVFFLSQVPAAAHTFNYN